jgi:hypothetical protein
MISNLTDTKENPANETCEKFNQSFYEVHNGTGVNPSQNVNINYKA